LLAGLAYQVCAMSFFVILMGIFQLRAQSAIKEHGYRSFCCVFSISTIMVYSVTIFRLAETAEGLGGRLSSNEIFFACLEFAPISIVVLLLDIWHLGRCLGAKVRVRGQKGLMHRDSSVFN
jgi:surface polysaccharide O-acyltransferase-like enzyme